MARIWLNHWFSTAYNIICLLREDNPSYTIIGSNENARSPIMAVCDEWYREPKLSGEAYAEYCLSFCIEHSIDVFLPRRGITEISKWKDRFEAAGVAVMADDYEYVSLFAQKDAAYRALDEARIGRVPDFCIARTPDEFARAYQEIAGKHPAVCFKFVTDEGGKSYRRIDNGRDPYSELFKKQGTRMSIDAAMSAFSERERFPSVIVMPYLEGDEISCDCLMTKTGLIAIPRVKDETRIEKVRYDRGILDACTRFFNAFPLKQPCNIQFKRSRGIPYLLEVNARMSGGIALSCAASGVNIPGIAAARLLGKEVFWHNPMIEKSVTHIETPLVL